MLGLEALPVCHFQTGRPVVPGAASRYAGLVDGCAVKRTMARLGRSIHVRGKGCAHDTTASF